MRVPRAASLLWVLLAGAAVAAPLDMPAGARQVAERVSPLDSYEMPIAVWQTGGVPARSFEGRVERQTWRLDSGALTTLQVLDPLRDQLDAAGFQILLDCKDSACGGFDFRFDTEVVPAPDMHVDIRNYRFLSAARNTDEALSLLVSRSSSAAYIQIIHVTPAAATPILAPPPEARLGGQGLTDRLLAQGHAVLTSLDFTTGSDTLANGPDTALAALAAFLEANPDLMIAFVGHTDSVGELDTNIALSKRRAEAVRQALLDRYGAPPARVRAEGMGYLAPVASNLTEAGREANRRVEVIVLPYP